MQTVILPNAERVILDNCKSYAAVGNTLVFNHADGTKTVYACGGAVAATAMAAAVDTLQNSTNFQATLTEPGLTWTSVTPSTGAINTPLSPQIAGGGFVNWFVGYGVNQFKMDDGAGHTVITNAGLQNDQYVLVSADSGGVIAPFQLTVAGTYTIYFSTDSGGTWTTTGLTIVAS